MNTLDLDPDTDSETAAHHAGSLGASIDAVHAILDFSARPFLQELAGDVHQTGERLNRRIHCIAESDLNDARIIRPETLGGFGLDAQWNEDFHHALHALATGERDGYYADFGSLKGLALQTERTHS